MPLISNIRANREIVARSDGPRSVIVVSGSEQDRFYWKRRFEATARDVFRDDGDVTVHSIAEGSRKGNFLGTLNGWRAASKPSGAVLMAMVFGQGKRLSPFTQTLGNRKPALPTPFFGERSQAWLCTADISNLYSNLWLAHLNASGFSDPVVVKWGDEAIIPGTAWTSDPNRFRDVDAIRFVWQTRPTEVLAREKDWILIDRTTGLMKQELTRQSLDRLQRRLGSEPDRYAFGVNLGSLAISRPLLDSLCRAFEDDLGDATKWVDWDPWAWVALCCRTEEDWFEEIRNESELGRTTLDALVQRHPDFYLRMARARAETEQLRGRPLRIGVLDFGEPLWIDLGLHVTMRKIFSDLASDSERGMRLRTLFDLPGNLDASGGIVLRSEIAPGADIRGSVILGSNIRDPASVLRGAVVVGTRAGRISMRAGGACLFSAAEIIEFHGPSAISLRASAPTLELDEGDRLTTIPIAGGLEPIRSNESVTDYEGLNYTNPILGNRLSFEQAGKLTAAVDGAELDEHWSTLLGQWGAAR